MTANGIYKVSVQTFLQCSVLLHAPKCYVVLHMQTCPVMLHAQLCCVRKNALSCLICCLQGCQAGFSTASSRTHYTQEADIDLEGLHWIVCHSGADIWHAQSDGEWNSDEQWENLIDFRCS